MKRLERIAEALKGEATIKIVPALDAMSFNRIMVQAALILRIKAVTVEASRGRSG